MKSYFGKFSVVDWLAVAVIIIAVTALVYTFVTR
jgi:hypothetical protein